MLSTTQIPSASASLHDQLLLMSGKIHACTRWPVATPNAGPGCTGDCDPDDGSGSDSDALKWISSKEEGPIAQFSQFLFALMLVSSVAVVVFF